jgi:dihydroxy-acid dehydratase
MGHAADPEKAGEAGRARHGAHLRRAHERHVGGPLALVATGDEIEVDVAARRIHLHVGDDELARRRAAWRPPEPRYARGYGAMFSAHIGQADEGCDFDFLNVAGRIPEPEIH